MRFIFLAVAALAGSACSADREYELRGQVLAVNEARREILVKHEDVRGFMPGMTMPFKVRDEGQLRERTPGELIRATLVVLENDAYLRAIERTGMAPVVDPPPAVSALDLLESGEMVPDATFVDQSGATRKVSEFRGRALAVTFIYTRCPLPNFCPLMDRHFAAVQQQAAGDPALEGRIHLVSVSFDPEFDTPDVMRAHAARAGADPDVWSFVTGDPSAIEAFARRFGVSILREEQPASEILHNLRTAVIDSEGRLVTVLGGNEWQPADLLSALRQAVGRR